MVRRFPIFPPCFSRYSPIFSDIFLYFPIFSYIFRYFPIFSYIFRYFPDVFRSVLTGRYSGLWWTVSYVEISNEPTKLVDRGKNNTNNTNNTDNNNWRRKRCWWKREREREREREFKWWMKCALIIATRILNWSSLSCKCDALQSLRWFIQSSWLLLFQPTDDQSLLW